MNVTVVDYRYNNISWAPYTNLTMSLRRIRTTSTLSATTTMAWWTLFYNTSLVLVASAISTMAGRPLVTNVLDLLVDDPDLFLYFKLIFQETFIIILWETLWLFNTSVKFITFSQSFNIVNTTLRSDINFCTFWTSFRFIVSKHLIVNLAWRVSVIAFHIQCVFGAGVWISFIVWA